MRTPLVKPRAKANGVNGHAAHAPAGTFGATAEALHAKFSDTLEKARARAEKGAVVPTLALWNQGTRIGGQLTPAQIAAIIREADTGDCRRLNDLANECRQTDSHLQAVLGTNEESLAGLPYQIIAPSAGAKPRAKDKRAAEWCEAVIRESPGVQRLIANLTGAYFLGHSTSEIVWGRDAGRQVPVRFEHIAQRRFRFRTSDGKLVLSDNGAAQVDLPGKYSNKFVVAQPRVNGDSPHREGLARPLVWMSAMRRWAIGDWLLTGEMSWKPWRIGTYKQSAAGRQDKEDLETILRRMTTDFTAVIPDSTSIAIEWPGGTQRSGSTHGEIVNVLAQEMSKCVLGQTETTQASASSGYAQAKVHNEVRRVLLEARAREIASIITRDLIAAMIRLNFGDSVAVPRFEFITREAIDLKAFSEALVNFSAVGLRVPQKWARDEAGIPEPTEGEEVLGLPAPATTPTPAKPPANQTPPDGTPAPAQENPPADQAAE